MQTKVGGAGVKVYIANFGRENHLWSDCLARSTVATLEGEDVRPLRLAGDREAYVERTVATRRTARGILPTRAVASRWFNLAGIIESTENDLWIHREKNDLWWTYSRAGEPQVVVQRAFHAADDGPRVCVIHKPADAWRNVTRHGNRLVWPLIHARAQEFLFTESTMQSLSADNSAYATALINGDDLSFWHSQQAWVTKAEKAKRNPGFVLNARQMTVIRMVKTACETVSQAKGQAVTRTAKFKENKFRNAVEFERYVSELLKAQEGLCAITGIPLQYDRVGDDRDLKCSLDRIDSNGHYEPGNLQVVCCFVNRWKNDDNDGNFRRLIAVVRSSGAT